MVMFRKGADEKTMLPASFFPSNLDVICGRDQESFHHEGNLRLRRIVKQSIPLYESVKSKKEKSLVVMEIVQKIRRERPEGGFVRKDLDTGRWIDIGEIKAREKVGHAIRIEIKKQSQKGRMVNGSEEGKPKSPDSCSLGDPSTVEGMEMESRHSSLSFLEASSSSRFPDFSSSSQEASTGTDTPSLRSNLSHRLNIKNSSFNNDPTTPDWNLAVQPRQSANGHDVLPHPYNSFLEPFGTRFRLHHRSIGDMTSDGAPLSTQEKCPGTSSTLMPRMLPLPENKTVLESVIERQFQQGSHSETGSGYEEETLSIKDLSQK